MAEDLRKNAEYAVNPAMALCHRPRSSWLVLSFLLLVSALTLIQAVFAPASYGQAVTSVTCPPLTWWTGTWSRTWNTATWTGTWQTGTWSKTWTWSRTWQTHSGICTHTWWTPTRTWTGPWQTGTWSRTWTRTWQTGTWTGAATTGTRQG